MHVFLGLYMGLGLKSWVGANDRPVETGDRTHVPIEDLQVSQHTIDRPWQAIPFTEVRYFKGVARPQPLPRRHKNVDAIIRDCMEWRMWGSLVSSVVGITRP